MAGTGVVVTGAGGFIGGHLVRRLAASGTSVRALDSRPRVGNLDAPGLAYHQVDIRDADGVARLVDGADTVYHLAAAHLEVHASPGMFEAVNVAAVEQLIQACRRAGVRRLVHTSSVGIYGHVSPAPATEDSPKHPKTAYERTKLAGELAAIAKAAAVDLDLVVLRPAWVYGPGCPRTAKLLRAVRRGRFVYVGGGRNLRHPIYIDDMVDAYLLAGAAPPSLSGRSFVIGGPRAVTLREFVEACARALGVSPPRLSLPAGLIWSLGLGAELAYRVVGREPPLSRRTLAFFENDSAFDTTAAVRDLGFRARVDLDEGLRRTVAEAPGAPLAPQAG